MKYLWNIQAQLCYTSLCVQYLENTEMGKGSINSICNSHLYSDMIKAFLAPRHFQLPSSLCQEWCISSKPWVFDKNILKVELVSKEPQHVR